MENNYRDKINLEFLIEDDSERLFADLDYILKDGVHIQNYGENSFFYDYLVKNHNELNAYYLRLFGVPLRKKGEGSHQFYYLDYHSREENHIPENRRYTIKNEYIIIGVIIYKIIFFDGYLELNSVEKLKKAITLDYEEYEEGLLKLIVKSDETGKLADDDKLIDKMVGRTLLEFKKLGWVDYKGDYFETLPSFHRLLYIYEDVIKNIKNILSNYK